MTGAPIPANADALSRGRRAEQALFAGLTVPATLVLLVVVFLPVFWLSALSFLDRAGEPSPVSYTHLTLPTTERV